MTVPTLSGAASRARALLEVYGINEPSEIDLDAIAFDRGVLVIDAPLTGADARLVRRGPTGLIRVREDIAEVGRRRFSVAHELGHFELHAASSQLEACLDPRRLVLYQEDPRERAADEFATELLMPTDLFRTQTRPPLLPDETLLRSLAREFQVTLTATVLRYVELGPVVSAVVLAADGVLKWFRTSSDFRFRVRTPGSRIDGRTVAAETFRGQTAREKAGLVPADAWLWDRRISDAWTIGEIAFPQLRYRSVLSFLWIIPQSDLDKT